MSWEIRQGDALEQLRLLSGGSVQTCITSPPYFGLRDYGDDGQVGLEKTPDEYVARLVEVFREVRRVLRDDGTVWLNLGDSYASGGSGGASPMSTLTGGGGRYRDGSKAEAQHLDGFTRSAPDGYKPKDLLGIPWMVAFALRADGWYLRSDIIWAKPNPMPESVTDRPTKAHEYIFLLSKGPRYFYGADAIREAHEVPRENGRWTGPIATTGDNNGRRLEAPNPVGRNKRSVWQIATQPFSWRKNARRVRVELGDVDDGTERITSRDCPMHGDRPAPAPTESSGGREGPDPSRRFGTDDHPVQEPLDGCVPTGQPPAPNSEQESSGSPDPECADFATPRSTGSYKTGPAPATTPACMPSAGSADHTGDTAESRGSDVLHLDTPENKTSSDDSDDPQRSRTPDRTAHRPAQLDASACTCEYYRLEETDHFAVFPPKLIEPCVLAGSAETDMVLDPFAGAGTTGLVATRHNRSFIGIELNPDYAEMARDRIRQDQPLFNWQTEVVT